MPYCRHCGQEVNDEQDFCLHCGKQLKAVRPTTADDVPDHGGFGWGLLGFCFPLVGLILYLVWNTTRPNTAKAAGLGALISVVGTFAIYIIYVVIIGLAIGCIYV